MSGLEAVLMAHRAAVYGFCTCGEAMPTDARYPKHGAMAKWHRAHVAAAIREWLLSDAVVERASSTLMRVAVANTEAASTDGITTWHDAARAVLTAATEEDARNGA